MLDVTEPDVKEQRSGVELTSLSGFGENAVA